MVPLFVDRQRELEFLENKYKENRAQLIILYGRRRIGKTELIKSFMQNKKGIYHLCTKEGINDNIKRLQEKMAELTGKNYFKSLNVSLDKLLEYFVDEIGNEKVVLALDEYQYLLEIDKGINSILQLAWDEKLSKSNIFLILLGSSIGMMENEILGSKSPLYGRRTASWKLTEINFPYLKFFYPNWKIEEIIKTWSILGGIPYYLNQFNSSLTVEENLRQNVFSKGSVLYNEPLFLLREEFREQRVYLSILKAISQGYNTVSKISDYTGLDRSNLTSYLDRLIENEIVIHEIPYQAKRGWYEIKDNFFDFWFKFVYTNLDYLEIGEINKVINRIDLTEYFSFKFEKLIRELIKSGIINLPFKPDIISRYIHKGEEVDIIAEGQGKIFLGEIKWSEKVDYRPLKKKLERIMEGEEKYYGFFAKSFSYCEGLCYDIKKLDNTISEFLSKSQKNSYPKRNNSSF
ncbi:ATP-binding protein [Acidianus manzaensis]|uniref:AAA family ATPase n=1 Tax=Acidianus manzaensis TaxID=282676 RepID=A0A1W6JYB5_9CREN|nr:ATP-binding protein [Acidianus manzaensis]ARM75194.1 AAA family ATPase [Acidianus manzaensis]